MQRRKRRIRNHFVLLDNEGNDERATATVNDYSKGAFSGSAAYLSWTALTQLVNCVRKAMESALGGASPSDVTCHPLNVRATSRSKDAPGSSSRITVSRTSRPWERMIAMHPW